MASEFPDVYEWLTYELIVDGATPVDPGKFMWTSTAGYMCTLCGALVAGAGGLDRHIHYHEYDALAFKVMRDQNFKDAKADIIQLRAELGSEGPASTYEPYHLAEEPERPCDD